MQIKKHIKKILTIAGIGFVGGTALIGCTQQPVGVSQDEVDRIKQSAYTDGVNAGVNSVDITSDNTAVVASAVKGLYTQEQLDNRIQKQKEADDQILNDFKQAQTQVQVEVEDKPAVSVGLVFIGEEKDNLELGDNIPVDVLTDKDVKYLVDDEVEVDGEDYDVQETIHLTTNLKIETSLSGDEEFEANPYLVFLDEEAVFYQYTFEDPIPVSEISEDDELVINFLGEPLTIVDVDSDSVTLREGIEITLNEGESKNIIGLGTVTLVAVSNNKVSVKVDGVTKTINEHDSKKIAGVDIAVSEIFYQDYAGGVKIAELVVGTDVQDTIKDGDEYFNDNDDFIWSLDIDGGELKSIGLKYDVQATDVDEEVLGMGETLEFPNGYFTVSFEYDEDYDYNRYRVDFDEAGDSDVDAMRFRSNDDDGLVVGTEEEDEVWFDGTTAYYKDDDNDWVETNATITLEFGDTIMEVGYSGGFVTVGDELKFKTADFKILGTEEDEAESDDIVVGSVEIGTRDEDVLTTEGIIINRPEDNADRDEVEFSIPDDEIEVVLKVGRYE